MPFYFLPNANAPMNLSENDRHLSRLNANVNGQNTNSLFDTLGTSRGHDEVSPWSASSSGTGYQSLTLPPINPDNNFDRLPPFDFENELLYADHSPNPFDRPAPAPTPASLPTSIPSSNPNVHRREDETQNGQEPPPSNQQQARRAAPAVSQYLLSGSPEPDPFADLLDLDSLGPDSPLPEDMPESSFVDLTGSSPVAQTAMAHSRKRSAATPEEGRVSKASRTSISKGPSGFKDDLVGTLNLVDIATNEEYEAQKAKDQAELVKQQNQEEATRSIKLGEFQCIICMDSPNDLTVTFCGHLFCSECLFQALYAGDKKCCPVCRSNISAPKPGTTKQPKNGVFALEMKVMTARRKGKQVVRQ
ncbi:hypothetical protein LZ554_004595 [Drepanopeziza brunnea f. sp. 'monogermtubi']|nr:hypothetical protein LZ554_004595 [Drepanopeziza brunnea f. sp. 'monogermtubi']